MICGRHNPVGMKVKWELANSGVQTRILPPEHFQGFTGLLHGGAISALLDDAMWWAVFAAREVITMTAEIQVRFKEPVPVESELLVRAEVVAERAGRLYKTHGQVLNAAGKVLAEADGKFLPAPVSVAATIRRDLE